MIRRLFLALTAAVPLTVAFAAQGQSYVLSPEQVATLRQQCEATNAAIPKEVNVTLMNMAKVMVPARLRFETRCTNDIANDRFEFTYSRTIGGAVADDRFVYGSSNLPQDIDITQRGQCELHTSDVLIARAREAGIDPAPYMDRYREVAGHNCEAARIAIRDCLRSGSTTC